MKRIVLILLLLTTYAALAQPTPYQCAPRQVELPPNLPSLSGQVLPPTSTSTWELPTGPHTRVGRACDREGDDFTFTLVSSTVPATLTLAEPGPDGWRTWTLQTTIVADIDTYVWTIQAIDARGATETYHVVAFRENTPPVVW